MTVWEEHFKMVRERGNCPCRPTQFKKEWLNNMEFLKYIWRPIDGLVYYESDFEFDLRGMKSYTVKTLAGIPVKEYFAWRWTRDNPGIDSFLNLQIDHIKTGRIVGWATSPEGAEIYCQSLIDESKVGWSSGNPKDYGMFTTDTMPKDFKQYVKYMSDTNEPVCYKDWYLSLTAKCSQCSGTVSPFYYSLVAPIKGNVLPDPDDIICESCDTSQNADVG